MFTASTHCAGEDNLSHDMLILILGACSACGSDRPAPKPIVPAMVTQQPARRPLGTCTPIDDLCHVEASADGNTVVAVSRPDGEGLVTLSWLKGSWC